MSYTNVRWILVLCLVLCTGSSAMAQGNLSDIENKLYAKFTLTQATADKTDIVTPGSIIVLRKSGFIMFGLAAQMPPTYLYKDGRLQSGVGNLFKMTMTKDGSDSAPKRTFVAGEKFWLTEIKVQQDAVILSFLSDVYNDVRYRAQIKFPFPAKKVVPPTDVMLSMIDEVVGVDGGSAQPVQAAQNAPQPPAQPLQAIAPPPPPPDMPPAPPKTITKGQTRDVVIAVWGQPTGDIKMGAKEILTYPSMKVILISGKVSDVQ